MGWKRCPGTRCPTLIPSSQRYCARHQREYERSRGGTAARGYGGAHTRLRRALLAKLEAGAVMHCPLCGVRLRVGEDLALDHTADRRAYRGLAHRRCNDSDGGKRSSSPLHAG